VFCCYVYVFILQCSTTRTVVTNEFQTFYIFFRAVPDVQLSIINPVLHDNGLTDLLHVQFYLLFLYKRAFHTCIVYMPIPLPAISIPAQYPQNDHYPQFHYTRMKSTHITH